MIKLYSKKKKKKKKKKLLGLPIKLHFVNNQYTIVHRVISSGGTWGVMHVVGLDESLNYSLVYCQTDLVWLSRAAVSPGY